MQKLDTLLIKIMEYIMFLCLSVTVLVTFVQVFYRYVLGQSLAWSQEFVLITFVYAVLTGAVVCIYHKEHLQVDLLDNKPAWLQKTAHVLEFGIVLFFIIIFTYYGIELVNSNLTSGQTVGILPIQTAYVYMAMPASGILMLYFHVRQVIK
ncbi:TRAP transporter small permease [Salibacterium aidingense]|uniref:TRAP transporter small permease n=1 Tax=Salibacterium aidingense TaxID=384933 RepID=UPI000429B6D7|nr:TRAP transporter small permease [Salibacterium aidingense]